MSKQDLERLAAAHPDGVVESHSAHGDDTAIVLGSHILPVMRWLRDSAGYDMLVDVTAVDYLGRDLRFEVVYHLRSMTSGHRLRVKVQLAELDESVPPEVDSVVSLWPGANWLEREVYDLYGIRFKDHPDLRRILLYEEFQGHPLRKDYPKEKRQPLVRRESLLP